jgi:hypothetical protein
LRQAIDQLGAGTLETFQGYTQTSVVRFSPLHIDAVNQPNPKPLAQNSQRGIAGQQILPKNGLLRIVAPNQQVRPGYIRR